jgi:hypothetical protein
MLTSGQVWQVLLDHAPRGKWLKVGDIYGLVSSHVKLGPDDLAPVASSGVSPKWQRTVRNALQRHKKTSEVDYDRKQGFRLPD